MSTNELENEVEVLADYLSDAAQQQRWIESWSLDQKYRASGGQIIYSVDTDTIKLYLNPTEEGPGWIDPDSLRPREGYTRIFKHDPDYVASALGYAIADHVFFDLAQENSPLLILPPLELELNDVVNALVKN